ncbi:septal ring lytic transglycosylase RlpA family protein [Colwellia sp. 1_MG-2023]|uniref:septal ring lytic transglycosylase RlpA family protein n=1 Tax=Colwellia sp. 1_MG-2023 TaxID=3062649 RepID=UPI0026E2C3CE|nr:septal ring lytic transglycosylase RlpA family protein [Colwellia sp. 1_MG-2023]MDO6446119.1 septal ring lytic transglycosylase RlpA family protein [Colwellia sp. 1_MG-2023]
MLKTHSVYRLPLFLKGLLVLLIMCVTGCASPKYQPRSELGNGSPYVIMGETYEVLYTSEGFRQTGRASWSGERFHGDMTSSGESYDMYAMTAAHPTLPIPTKVRVTNTENGRVVVVTINDRGAWHSDEAIVLSYAAAKQLDLLTSETAKVKIESLYVPAPE